MAAALLRSSAKARRPFCDFCAGLWLIKYSTVEIIPTGKALGAEVRGVDLGKIQADEFESIYRAWLDHLVLLFRGQDLTDEDLIAFSRRFGELDHAPIQESGRRFGEGHPELYILSNVIENGERIGSRCGGEASWHTDMRHLADPPKPSRGYALSVRLDGRD